MSEVESVDEGIDSDDLFEYSAWAMNKGIWDGRDVTYKDALNLSRKAFLALMNDLFAEESSLIQFQKMAAELAWIGTCSENKHLLDKDIQELNAFSDNFIIKTGFCDSAKKFWKKHKKKILIGAGIAAIITVAVIVSVCSGAAVPAAAALKGKDKKKKKPKAVSLDPPQVKPPKTENPFEKIDLEPSKEITFTEDGIKVGGKNFTYKEILQKGRSEELLRSFNYKPNSTISNPLSTRDESEDFLKSFIPEITKDLTMPNNISNEKYVTNSFEEYKQRHSKFFRCPEIQKSRNFHTEGVKASSLRIGGINGINTTINDASSHASYIKKFAGKHSIDWVYNQTNGLRADISETVFLNYMGASPITSKLLQKNWTDFHYENKNNQNAKYLQICHSQGAIHVKNALKGLPKEIRERIIVVAIAPAAIITEDTCYASFNYASKKDPVPKAEYYLMFNASLSLDLEDRLQLQKSLQERQKELILIEPHPDAKGIDHDFQSPTLESKLRDHIAEYKNQNGEYE